MLTIHITVVQTAGSVSSRCTRWCKYSTRSSI